MKDLSRFFLLFLSSFFLQTLSLSLPLLSATESRSIFTLSFRSFPLFLHWRSDWSSDSEVKHNAEVESLIRIEWTIHLNFHANFHPLRCSNSQLHWLLSLQRFFLLFSSSSLPLCFPNNSYFCILLYQEGEALNCMSMFTPGLLLFFLLHESFPSFMFCSFPFYQNKDVDTERKNIISILFFRRSRLFWCSFSVPDHWTPSENDEQKGRKIERK